MSYEAALFGYQKCEFTNGPWTRFVYRRGRGPAVIVIHEMPGLHPLVIRFANRVADAGMTVFLPVLFGVPGKPVTRGYTAWSLLSTICIRREFNVWSAGKSSPIVAWLSALARNAHAECGGKGVGAVGMCFTGGFALAMMAEPCVVAPVLPQPSLPMPFGSKRASGIDAYRAEIACAKKRFADENLSMIGLRFKCDKMVRKSRFETYRHAFGENFEAIELDPQDAQPSEFPPHSVLTVHMKEEGPTKEAEQRVIAFLKRGTAPISP
jgi:dienelactone hydrolase